MARLLSSNYSAAGTQFQWADDDSEHPLFPEDLGRLAQAFESHTHIATRGLAVERVADLSIHAAAYQNASIGSTKLAAASVLSAAIADDAVLSQHIADAQILGPHLNGQMVHGTNHIVPGSITPPSIGVLTGNPALRFGPLGHASYGSIRWDGDGGAGTYLYDATSGGSPGRHIIQARSGTVHLLNADGTSWANVVMGGLDVQAGFAVTLRSAVAFASGAGITMPTGVVLLQKDASPVDASIWSRAGLQLQSAGMPALAFDRPGIEHGALYLLNGSLYLDVTAGARKIWDAGNHGAGSGLNADLLDGNDATAFALAGHTHAGATGPFQSTSDGSAAAPAFDVFTGGHHGGLYGDSTGAILLSTNGVHTATFDNNGTLINGGFLAETQTGQRIRTQRILYTFLDQSSDRDLKKNINHLELDSLNLVRQLTPRRFIRKGIKHLDIPEQDGIGFIAQEVHDVAPDIATEKSIDTFAVITLLAHALKQLTEKVDALEAQR